MNNLIKLISIGSETLVEPLDEYDFRKIVSKEVLAEELEEFYSLKNGFYAFESSLHVFPISDRKDVMSFQEWNSHELWRKEFPELDKTIHFFAEDIFGFQFCLKDDEIFMFNGESFTFTPMSKNLEEWAEKILNKYNYYTGFSLAHEWQQKNGPLKTNKRLGPMIPFVAGGKFEVGNLGDVDSAELMRYRASLYKQFKDLPDGTKVKLVVKKSVDKDPK